nr:immunoglobulin heavy chain junction region [Homo sapiens]
CATLRLGYW